MKHRLLFVSFDGVLHPRAGTASDTGKFKWGFHLHLKIRDVPDVGIVIHAPERDDSPLESLASQMRCLGTHVVGMTDSRLPRWEGIKKYLAEAPDVDSYRILDDSPREFPQWLPELITCDPQQGVRQLGIQHAVHQWLTDTRSTAVGRYQFTWQAALQYQMRTRSEPTIFLDFDGVVHAAWGNLPETVDELRSHAKAFEWLPFLTEALALYPTVRIVVSSAWRHNFDDGSLRMLLGTLGPRFDGSMVAAGETRVDEIKNEAKRRRLTRWIAIDDHESIHNAARKSPRFIPCNPDEGLSSPLVQANLRAQLASMLGT